jgi:hypothetical protein
MSFVFEFDKPHSNSHLKTPKILHSIPHSESESLNTNKNSTLVLWVVDPGHATRGRVATKVK